MLRRLAAGVVPLTVTVVLVPSTAQAGGGIHRDIAAARIATAPYHVEKTAIADGYQRVDRCVDSPEGAMGYHYVNPALVGGRLDVSRPQVVIYQPTGDGGRKLVAVEYVVNDADQDTGTDDDRPHLFGRPFDGPHAGHEPGQPIHYDLHAWIWQYNPDGMFAMYNPAGSC